MTRIDFYILGSAADGGRDMSVCRLVHKAFASGHRIYIRTADDDAARRLDDLLWTFNQGSFIPHALHPTDGKEEFQVLIGHDEPPTECNDVLIQLAPEPFAAFERFQRVLEVVGSEENDKLKGRERFRFYRERGCTPITHTL
jgi:DNA polymerase-3 subunit chi